MLIGINCLTYLVFIASEDPEEIFIPMSVASGEDCSQEYFLAFEWFWAPRSPPRYLSRQDSAKRIATLDWPTLTFGPLQLKRKPNRLLLVISERANRGVIRTPFEPLDCPRIKTREFLEFGTLQNCAMRLSTVDPAKSKQNISILDIHHRYGLKSRCSPFSYLYFIIH